MSWLGDPKKLSVGILISNMIACRTSLIQGMSGEEQSIAASEIIKELNRRFPNDIPESRIPAASAFDTVEGADSVKGKTENLPTETGYYFAQFFGPLEVVFYNHDRKIVLRIDGTLSFRGKDRQYGVHEFKWIQKAMWDPGLDFNCHPTELSKELAMDAHHEQSPAEIQVDFEDTFNILKEAEQMFTAIGQHTTSQAVRAIKEMFQNPAVIIPKD